MTQKGVPRIVICNDSVRL